MDGPTDGLGEGLRVKRDARQRLQRRTVQPYRRLYAAHLYWGAARVVARGGAMPIGGLQPASLGVLFRRVGSARRPMRAASRLSLLSASASTNSRGMHAIADFSPLAIAPAILRQLEAIESRGWTVDS